MTWSGAGFLRKGDRAGADAPVSEAGPMENFVDHLQQKLDEKLENGYPPNAPALTDFIEG